MFVVPDLSVTPAPTRRRPSPARSAVLAHGRSERAIPRWLLAWLAAGIAAVVLVPALRGDAASGATWPFWLVGAPLIDLAWLRWRRLLAACRALVRRLVLLRGARQRGARRQRSSARRTGLIQVRNLATISARAGLAVPAAATARGRPAPCS